ncbi:MAG: glycosyltransferase family 2 protein [Lachnospiraceae bacterium]
MKIVAGIVLYNPDITRVMENINAIITQVDDLILVDNGSNNISEIEKSVSHLELEIIKNTENKGIAKALNQIFDRAIAKEAQWCLTLDQDSVCPKDMIQTYKKYINDPEVGILCPQIKDRNLSTTLQEVFSEDRLLVKGCITSGSFVKIEAFQEVHGFDERMFIDYVDCDFTVRIQECKKHFKIYKIQSLTLLHQVGDIQEVNLFGRKEITTNHSAIRRFYYMRNRIYCAKKYPNYVGRKDTFTCSIKTILLIILFEKNKGKKLFAIMNGIIQGFIFR